MHLLLATPCYGGQVHHLYMISVIKLMQLCSVRKIPISIELLGGDSLVTRGRNTLAAKFLNTPSATHLLFVDADIAFEPEQVLRMAEFGEPVVAGLYPVKTIHWDEAARQRAQAGETIETAPFRYVGAKAVGKDFEQRDGFVTAVYAGTGFLLIQRSVLERMALAFPNLRYTAIHTRPEPDTSPNQFAFFDCMIEPETGHYLSEDYSFCWRWRKMGGRIWLDTQGRLTHIGTHEFLGNPQVRFQQ